MPRDVHTQWNSTYDMLRFALEYRKAIDTISGEKTNNLHKYELTEAEWTVAAQLCRVLKVSTQRENGWIGVPLMDRKCTGLQRRDTVLLAVDPQSRNGDSSNGSHRRTLDGRLSQSKPRALNQGSHRPCKEDPQPLLLKN